MQVICNKYDVSDCFLHVDCEILKDKWVGRGGGRESGGVVLDSPNGLLSKCLISPYARSILKQIWPKLVGREYMRYSDSTFSNSFSFIETARPNEANFMWSLHEMGK